MEPFHINIEKATLENTDYRRVLYTTNQSQLVLMSLKPGENVHMEIHPKTTQFVRIERGKGKAVYKKFPDKELSDGISIMVPSNTYHEIINTSSTEDLKLYTIYSPPEHKPGLVQKERPIDIVGKLPPVVGQEILSYLDDESLAYACMTNKNFNRKICNNDFWIARLKNRFPELFDKTGTVEDIKEFVGKNSYWAYYIDLNDRVKYKYDNLYIKGALNGRFDLIKIANKRGDDIHYHNEGPLIHSSIRGDLKMIKYFLDREADIHSNDDEALREAAKHNKMDAVDFLLANGADIKNVDLSYFINTDNLDMIKFLIERGAIVKPGDLSLAEIRNPEIYKFLRDRVWNR